MSDRVGSATERRLEVTIRRQRVEKRKKREAARRAGIREVRPPYRPHRPYKTSGRDHRTFYGLKIQAGFILAELILIGLFSVPLYPAIRALEINFAEQELIELEEITQTLQESLPPPPPRPSVPVLVADDVFIEDDELNLDATLDIDEYLTDVPAPPPAPPEPKVVEEVEEPEIFVVVEQPPVMIGDFAELMQELRYPEMARHAGVEGRVTIQYVVDENGDVIDPFVLKGIGAGCDEEALRVIKLMKFEPGRQRGILVRVRMATGVNFRLTST